MKADDTKRKEMTRFGANKRMKKETYNSSLPVGGSFAQRKGGEEGGKGGGRRLVSGDFPPSPLIPFIHFYTVLPYLDYVDIYR